MGALTQISAANARLPATYDNAKQALAECVRIDECQGWADKAAALASYAKQADDDELLKMATRIKGRAVRRAGELLKQIEEKRGANQNIREGDRPNVLTRSDAATSAGMSPHQAKQAIRVANVPRDEFDAQVEGDAPPTITALALQGVKKREPIIIDHREGRSDADFQAALHFTADILDAAKTLSALDVERTLPSLLPRQRDEIRTAIKRIDAFTDRIATRI